MAHGPKDIHPHHVVIVGGGFGGLYAARSLRHAPVRVTVIDRRNFHLFQPLLYQVALGQLSPANIAAPLRNILHRQKNAHVLMAEATGLDVAGKRVLLSDGDVPYDSLILATGSRHHYFGRPDWEPLAPGLKTIEDATTIRRRVLLAFEEAERAHDPARVQMLLTFVIVGGGPTGVELAGTLAELSRHTLRNDFRSIDPSRSRILLVEGTDRILPTYPPDLSQKAVESLHRLGVVVRTGALVTALEGDAVTLRTAGHDEIVAARTVLWAAGVEASPMGKALAKDTGVALDRAGRVVVQADLSIPGHPDIFVIGDLANYAHQEGKPLPGVAPVAMQQGHYVARLIENRLRGRTMAPFRYTSHGNMATIGKAAAVADLGWIRFSGLFAWLAWLFIHLIYLIQFQNRLLVLMQWAVHYVTGNRAARLITGTNPLPFTPPTSKSGTPT